jgi:hypothetical protein
MKPLTSSTIEQAIDKATHSDEAVHLQELKKHDLVLHRATEADEWKYMMAMASPQAKTKDDDDLSNLALALPLHSGIAINNASTGNLCGLVTFYIAYSSWDGRILYVDCLQCSEITDAVEILLLQTLAAVAIDLDCIRLTWRVRQLCVGLCLREEMCTHTICLCTLD